MNNSVRYISYVVNVLDSSNLDLVLQNVQEFQKGRADLYEIIFVNNTGAKIDLGNYEKENLYIIDLVRKSNEQVALAIGVEFAKGDFVYEFYSQETFVSTYISPCEKYLGSFDIILCAQNKRRVLSFIFDMLLNWTLPKNLRVHGSVLFTIASRRAINKLGNIGSHIVNRRIAYALTGLSISQIKLDARIKNYREGLISSLVYAVQTFLYYTDFIKTSTVYTSIVFFVLSMMIGAYTIESYIAKSTAPGWASLSILICISFSGVFMILGMIAFYLDNILGPH